MLIRAAVACAVAVAAPAVAAAGAAQDGIPEPARQCRDNACLVIKYEAAVAREAAQLAEALRIRLSPLRVRVVAEEYGAATEPTPTSEPEPGAAQRLLWIVHLRRLSSGLYLVAIDNFIGAGADDFVREVAAGETAESTIWTISLMIEENVIPYVNKDEDSPALGAGLAIIEPPAVGGIARQEPLPPRQFPKLHLVGLGAVVIGVVPAGEFAAGPIVSVEGIFAPKFLTSISVGWAGFVHYSRAEIKGRAQYIPMEIGLGYRMYDGPAVELSVWTGLAVGFALYRTQSTADDASARTDVLFEPGALAALRLSFRVYGPLALYLVGGATVSLVRDVLENSGSVVFESGWVAPDIELGVQVKL
jgi:hypothetical protein